MPNNAPASDTRDCPECAETIKAAAKLCRYCKSQITPVGERPRPEVVEAEIVELPLGADEDDDLTQTIREGVDVVRGEFEEGIGGILAAGNSLVDAYQDSPEVQEKIRGAMGILERLSMSGKSKKKKTDE